MTNVLIIFLGISVTIFIVCHELPSGVSNRIFSPQPRMMRFPGWREYCFDRTDSDTARPMFRKESNTRMRTSKVPIVQFGCTRYAAGIKLLVMCSGDDQMAPCSTAPLFAPPPLSLSPF